MKPAETKVLQPNEQKPKETLADALTWPDSPVDTSSQYLVQSLVLNLIRPDESLTAGLTLVRAGAESLMPPSDLLSQREMDGWNQQDVVAKRKNEIFWGKFAAKSSALIIAKNLKFTQLEVSGNIFGSPNVQTPKGQVIGASITHTRSLAAALAFPMNHPMGIDLEQTAPNHRDVISAEMTDKEIHRFENLNLPGVMAFTLNWTIKEAYSKALGIGVTTPFRALEVKQIEEKVPGQYESWLLNFTQFRVLSWVRGTYVMSLAVPYKTTLQWSKLK